MTGFSLENLEKIIQSRADSGETESYTASLLSCGIEKCAQKLGEEAVEAAIAAATGDKDGLRKESADLLYHLLVVLKASNISLSSVMEELKTRTSQSGLEEKAGRKKK